MTAVAAAAAMQHTTASGKTDRKRRARRWQMEVGEANFERIKSLLRLANESTKRSTARMRAIGKEIDEEGGLDAMRGVFYTACNFMGR